ncbi:MAG: carboxypeptidase-like regulatory domain-containing protein, partial [Acidobacteriota bacterium]|nr:carboxypeptidase-like regulatory domain-containing protein [Acidobacteriota bacterium]
MKKLIQIFAFSLMMIAFTDGTMAQTFKATVVGQVVDSAGGAVPNATITITLPATNQTQTVTSDGEGNFTISQLDPGSYTLRVEAANFKILEQTN